MEANMAYYALHKLHILPGRLMELPRSERAFIYASVSVRLEAERKEAAKRRR